MKTQKKNWWLDVLLFLGFMICFFLDLTGVELHQWIGIGIGVLVFIHFALHIDWTTTVLGKFFNGTSMRSRLYFLIDGVIAFGFMGIIFTGLIISTWLNLALINLDFWINFHILISVVTLFMVLLKVALHRKWIVCIAETQVFKPKIIPECAGDVLLPIAKKVDRREFLKLGAVLGAGTLVGVIHLHDVFSESGPAPQSTVPSQTVDENYSDVLTGQANSQQNIPVTVQTQPTTMPTIAPTSVSVPQNEDSTTCTILCSRRCSFPGKCRRYIDSNGNGKCDNGECL